MRGAVRCGVVPLGNILGCGAVRCGRDLGAVRCGVVPLENILGCGAVRCGRELGAERCGAVTLMPDSDVNTDRFRF